MTYEQTIEYLYESLPMFHRIGKAAYKANLDNISRLAEALGNPQNTFKSIHVAGTNGKGSVSHGLAAVLQEFGLKVGLFTSPHLKDFRERARINGECIGQEEVVQFVQRVIPLIEKLQPSFFEITVALAFDWFKNSGVDIAVIEVGMGGRLDSTNIITPLLSVITNIGFDHTEFLGDSLPLIAKEKAGIIKSGVPVVIGEYHKETFPVFEEVARDRISPLTCASVNWRVDSYRYTDDGMVLDARNINTGVDYPELRLDLGGKYQVKNLCTLLEAIARLQSIGLKINPDHIREGLAGIRAKTGLMGRWQILGKKPLVICDTGHNADGLSSTMSQIKEMQYRQLHMVIGFVKEKIIEPILALLPRDAVYYYTRADIPRALPEKELMEQGRSVGLNGSSYKSVKEAFDAAIKNAGEDDLVFVGGSTFVVAEII